MALNHFIVFDLETGGFDCKKNPIMEIALIVRDAMTLEELTRWESLVKVYDNLVCEKGALDVHGISVSDCNNRGMDLKEMVETVKTICKKFTPKGDKGGGRPILAGHNVGFDIAYMKDVFQRCDSDLSDYVLSASGGEIVVFDTLPNFKLLYPDPKEKFTLGEICKRIGLGDFIAHRAMPDVIAASEVMLFLKGLPTNSGKLKSKEEQANVTGGKDRVAQQSNPKRIKFEF